MKGYFEMNAMISITDTKALELYSEILNAADVRLGRKPNMKLDLSKAMTASIINEYRQVLTMPQDYIRRYKAAKISSIVCVALPSIGIF